MAPPAVLRHRADEATNLGINPRLAFQVTGQHDDGVILQPVEEMTDDWNTLASSVDHGAASADGGVGYFHVLGASDLAAYSLKIRHSVNNALFVDLLEAAGVVGDRKASRLTVAGNVNRYLAVTGTITGMTADRKARSR